MRWKVTHTIWAPRLTVHDTEELPQCPPYQGHLIQRGLLSVLTQRELPGHHTARPAPHARPLSLHAAGWRDLVPASPFRLCGLQPLWWLHFGESGSCPCSPCSLRAGERGPLGSAVWLSHEGHQEPSRTTGWSPLAVYNLPRPCFSLTRTSRPSPWLLFQT